MFDRLTSPLSLALAVGATLAAFSMPNQAKAQDAFIGEIIPTAIGFCPQGTAEADGSLQSIAQNNALFALYGTIYGGDGINTFGLPDLRGRKPLNYGQGQGPSYQIGEKGGSPQTTLTLNNLAQHNHMVNASNAVADKRQPATDYFGDPAEAYRMYHDGPPNVQMDPAMISQTGGSQAFPIQDPYLAMRYCVVLFGIFPSRS